MLNRKEVIDASSIESRSNFKSFAKTVRRGDWIGIHTWNFPPNTY